MKYLLRSLCILGIAALLSSCKKDAGRLPNVVFKTGGTYTSADASITGGTTIIIGINANKTEDKDVLKKFNISKTVNGAAATTVYSQDLSGAEGDNYTYDYNTTLEATVGQTDKFTFTITNRDGLVNQVFLTVTIK